MARFQRRRLLGGGTALSLIVAASSSIAGNANPQRTFVAPPARAYPGGIHTSQTSRRRNAGGPGLCSGDGIEAQVVAGDANVAAGDDSGVLSGAQNFACGYGSTVVAGGWGTGHDGSFTYNAVAGGQDSFIGAGNLNSTSGTSSFVGAGGAGYLMSGASSYCCSGSHSPPVGNFAGATDAFVGGGDLNQIASAGNGSFIGGGGFAYATTEIGGFYPTTGGNTIAAVDAFIGAGDLNVVDGNESVVAGGQSNSIGSAATDASILGGGRNNVTAEYASILGGFGNTAGGPYAIVAGGDADTAAGTLSFAAGYHADAGHNGSFVWSDYEPGSSVLKDTAANQFVVRASGGVHVYSNETASAGVELTPGSGTWANLSDRNAKTGIAPLDDDAILAKVERLPIDAWQYRAEKGVRHVGPMAQDFYAAFGTGVDNRHITSIDEDGVALAAIESLAAKLGQMHRENGLLVSQLRQLDTKNATLERRLDALEARVP